MSNNTVVLDANTTFLSESSRNVSELSRIEYLYLFSIVSCVDLAKSVQSDRYKLTKRPKICHGDSKTTIRPKQ